MVAAAAARGMLAEARPAAASAAGRPRHDARRRRRAARAVRGPRPELSGDLGELCGVLA